LDSPSPQHGGPFYGLGRDDAFWASGLSAANRVQNVAREASEQYDLPVLGNYVMMGPDSINYAQHYADANLAAINPAKMSKSQIEDFNNLVRRGSKKSGPRPSFPGIENPTEAYLHFSIDPEQRKHFNAQSQDEFDALSSEVLRFNKWPAIARTIKQRRYYLRQLIEHYRKTKIPVHLHKYVSEKQRNQLATIDNVRQLKQLEQLQQLQQLKQLEQLQRLQQLQQLQQLLTITSKDYRDGTIERDAVVYCDIPYAGTADYGGAFSHKDFFDWAASREFPVFISEYNVPDPRFKLVYTVDKRCLLTSDGESNKVKQEKLYWNGVV
jgi:hypothetical protein